jgi:hypothetical protein
MDQAVLIVLPLVVRTKEILHTTRNVCMIPGVGINERDGVIYGAVRVTDGPDILGHRPTITDDGSAGFDPSMYNFHQCVSGSIRYGNKESSTGLTFNTAKHPLSHNRVSPMVLTPTELALVELDCLVRTADLLRAAL